MGALSEIIEKAGGSLTSKTVMSGASDPYRIDTPANHLKAQWLAEAWQACKLTEIHTRGLHYAFVSLPNLIKPNGDRYLNTDQNWCFLQIAVNQARWLEYIDFEAITDERNAGPELYFPPRYDRVGIEVEHSADMLAYLSRMPTLDVFCQAPHARQAFRLVLIGEKSSLRNVLRPICQKYEAELVLPTGELSTTLLHGIVKRAAADGRPCRVFYLSDFDPSGMHMPVEVSRKVQALCDIKFPDLDIEVHRCALLPEQVQSLGLPETPMKEGEKRAEKWRERYGCEQTEIDALATLNASVLAEIVENALNPYFDLTLQKRQSLAFRFAQNETREKLDRAMPAYEPVLIKAQSLIDEAVRAQKLAYEFAYPLFEEIAQGVAAADPVLAESHLDERLFAAPIFSSLYSFDRNTSRLMGEKL